MTCIPVARGELRVCDCCGVATATVFKSSGEKYCRDCDELVED